MRDDPEYWQALSARIVSGIRERRDAKFGWRVWAAPLAVAAVLTLLISQASRQTSHAPVVERAPSIAAMLTPGAERAPSIARLLGEPR